MADKKKMSIEDILAAARKADGSKSSESSAGAETTPEATSEPAKETPKESPAKAQASEKPAAPKKPGAMNVADILAAARAEKSAGGEPQAEAPAAAEKPAAEKPAAKPAAGKPAAAKPGSMSVADILAAARANKGGAAPAAEPKAETPAKAAPKEPKKAAPAKAAAAKEPAAPAASGGANLKDTASILAAARASAKPGPISKSELAAREKDTIGREKEVGKKKGVVPPMPEKPEYAITRPAPAAPTTAQVESRRGFMQSTMAGIVAAFAGSSLAIGFSSLAVTLNLWTLGFARFMFPNVLIEPPTRFKVGVPGELAQGQVQTKFGAQFGVWIVRHEYDGQPQIYAIQTVCTHLGCTPNWLESEQKFKCPCHGSGFYKDGINFEGPAPRPLERFAIRLADDGQLEVDKSRKFKEEVGQWRDPACFVPV